MNLKKIRYKSVELVAVQISSAVIGTTYNQGNGNQDWEVLFMEEAYWKQFMATGRVEDYLHFKEVSQTEKKNFCEIEAGKFEGDRPDAGIGKCNSHCT